MSNGSPPTTIEGYTPIATGKLGLVPPNLAAHLYNPVAPTQLIPALDPPDNLEEYPGFSTNGVGIAPDLGIWLYQPNVPSGWIEIIPSLQPPTNSAAPSLTYVTGGGGAGNVGSQYACSAGTWTPSTPMPTFTRQWLRDGAAIPGATATTYTIQTADVGHVITAQVIATNPAGSSAPATSSNSVGPIPDPGETRRANNHKKR